MIDSPNNFRFYDYTANAPWNGSPMTWNDINVSTDQGTTWSNLPRTQTLFGAYFFVSTDQVNYHFDVFNIIYLAQSIGGIFGLLLAMFRFIGEYINHELVLAKFIRSLFY